MITKTLGGDRLGAGKKQKVHMHGYERSTHDLGNIWRSSMASGTLVPFLSRVLLPGDTFDINLDCDVKTHPTIGPLFGSYKVQLDLFLTPVRLYNARLHNNALNIGRNMSQVKLPQIELTALQTDPDDVPNNDYDNIQINPSCILKYLGLSGIGIVKSPTESATRQFNVLPYLMYVDIYKHYYANKQEEEGAVIHNDIAAITNTITDPIEITPQSTGVPENLPTAGGVLIAIQVGDLITINYVGTTPRADQIMLITNQYGAVQLSTVATIINDTGTVLTYQYTNPAYNFATLTAWRYIGLNDLTISPPTVVRFPLENIDTMREEILRHDNTTFVINDLGDLPPYSYIYEPAVTIYPTSLTQEGLLIKTYQSDLLNNWINTEWIDDINAITAIDTSGGSFQLDTLAISKKVWEILNRVAVSGGTYDDWEEVVYDHEKYRKCESPMYMGGLIKELVFQEVVSNSEAQTDRGTQPLGTLAGKGVMAKKHKGGHAVIKVDEISYLIGIVSITPRIDNSQGNEWDVNLKTMDDFHKPGLDEIGFQELITEQMAWFDTEWDGTEWVQKSAGKQPAWLNYMTSINQTRGNFAIQNNEMFMTLNRRYETVGNGITDITTYIDPSKFNFIFTETNLDAQNFWVQIAIDITARRKMSAKLMPNI